MGQRFEKIGGEERKEKKYGDELLQARGTPAYRNYPKA